jgi:hypothetical protein
MKVRIYSSHCSRSDYILFQYTSIQKHVKDEIEYIVINDGQNEPTVSNFMNPKCRDEIEEICRQLKIQCIPLDPTLHRNRNLLYPKKVHPICENYSQRAADACQFILRDSLSFEGIVCILDSDNFFNKDISLNDAMEGYTLSYIPSVRQGIHHMWNNLVIYKPHELPNLHELNFDLGNLPGNPLDTGGMTYEYLLKYKSSLKIRIIEITNILLDQGKPLEDKTSYLIPSQCKVLEDSFGEEIPQDSSIEWQTFDIGILHYGQGGNWNKKGYFDHCIKTKTLLWGLAESLLPKKHN